MLFAEEKAKTTFSFTFSFLSLNSFYSVLIPVHIIVVGTPQFHVRPTRGSLTTSQLDSITHDNRMQLSKNRYPEMELMIRIPVLEPNALRGAIHRNVQLCVAKGRVKKAREKGVI